MARMESARVVLEVTGGLIPGRPDSELTRRWALTSAKWHDLDDRGKSTALAELNGQAQGYAGLLMLQPDRLNWVRLDWVWL